MYTTNPKSKADLLSRILSQSFTGDLRDLAVDRLLTISRPKQHLISLKFPDGRTFLLTIHKPKPEAARQKAKLRWRQRHKPQASSPQMNDNLNHHEAVPLGRYA